MKPEAHKHIAKEVLISTRLNLNFSDKEIKWIIRGTSLEDWWSLRQRARNWHFYRSNDFINEKEKFLLGKSYTTSEKRVDKLVLKLKKSRAGKKKRYIILGRIIHHIQDMSTPSHVVPIYHGPGKEDVYETYMMKHIKDDLSIIDNITTVIETESYRSIYEKFAKLTLSHLENELVPLRSWTSDIKYEKIWIPFPQTQGKYIGFGDFGEYGNCFSDEVAINSINIDIPKIYKHFCSQAAQSTYEALLSFKMALKG